MRNSAHFFLHWARRALWSHSQDRKQAGSKWSFRPSRAIGKNGKRDDNVIFSIVPNQWLYYTCCCQVIKAEHVWRPFGPHGSRPQRLFPETPFSATCGSVIQRIPADNVNRQSSLFLEGKILQSQDFLLYFFLECLQFQVSHEVYDASELIFCVWCKRWIVV